MLNKVALTGLSAVLLASGGITLGNLFPLFDQDQVAHSMPSSGMAESTQGLFQSAEKETHGQFKVQWINGKQYLQFDSAFVTSSGPQVEVLLHREAVPTTYDDNSYISLGTLKAVKGTQTYEIPETVDISAYRSISIWCRDFDVTFGYATFAG